MSQFRLSNHELWRKMRGNKSEHVERDTNATPQFLRKAILYGKNVINLEYNIGRKKKKNI